MPIYEYECKNCHQTTEALQKFSDPPLSDCPQCNGRLQKLMSLNSFHLKGSGWYVTDYSAKKSGSQVDKSTTEEVTKDSNSTNSEKSDTTTKSSSEE